VTLVKRVLIVSGDVLPLPNYPTSGAGLRAWGIGHGLRSHGFEVTFAMPQVAVRQDIKSPTRDYDVRPWLPDTLERVIAEARPDAVVFCHWPSVQIRKRLDVPTIIDFHGPHMLERAFQGLGRAGSNALTKIEALRKADFFTCAGEKQRLYFLAWLLASGIDISQPRIASIPVCLSPELPEPLPPPTEVAFVYGGVYLPWQDPSLSLTVTANVLDAANRGMLYLFGGKHPSIPIAVPPTFVALEKQLRANPRVSFQGILPRDELIEAYRGATAAVDLMAYNYERELAFTTRTVEYMWCGLPVIYNNYAELSPLIHDYNAGWILDPNDRDGLIQVVQELLDNPATASICGRNAQRLVREHLTWDRAIAPLVAFLSSPQLCEANEADIASFVATELGTRHFWDRWSSVKRKDAGALFEDGIRHFRQGGLTQLARETLGFARRRLHVNN
jgi:hypothetical protein